MHFMMFASYDFITNIFTQIIVKSIILTTTSETNAVDLVRLISGKYTQQVRVYLRDSTGVRVLTVLVLVYKVQ